MKAPELRPSFARLLKAVDRKENTLSPIIRQAWDTGKSVVMDAGILKTDVKYDEIIDMSFVESVRASL